MNNRHAALKILALTFGLWVPPALMAQTWPVKPVRVIIPFAPGGPMELASRPVTNKLTEALGRPMVIEYKPGAAGVIGTDYAAKAVPDGYTLLMISSAQLSTPATVKSLPYDMVKDFSAISNVAQSGLVLVVNPALKINSVPELISFAKAAGRPMNFGSSGAGGAVHLAMEYMFLIAGIQGLHVPYKGVGPALQDVIAGRLDMMFGGVSGVAPFARTGKLKVLAFGGAKRSRLMPDIPTVAETTRIMEKFAVDSSYGLLAPAKTPNAVIARVSTELKRVLESPDIEQIYLALSVEPWWTSPAETATWVKDEIDKWHLVAKAINYQPE